MQLATQVLGQKLVVCMQDAIFLWECVFLYLLENIKFYGLETLDICQDCWIQILHPNMTKITQNTFTIPIKYQNSFLVSKLEKNSPG